LTSRGPKTNPTSDELNARSFECLLYRDERAAVRPASAALEIHNCLLRHAAMLNEINLRPIHETASSAGLCWIHRAQLYPKRVDF
jgi:hypothetical protein